MRWQGPGHASAADSWEPAEHLANCQERVAEYEAAAPRRPKALRAHQGAGPAPLARRETVVMENSSQSALVTFIGLGRGSLILREARRRGPEQPPLRAQT